MIEVGEVRRRPSILRHVIKRWIYGADLRLKSSKSIVIDHNSREITADGGRKSCARSGGGGSSYATGKSKRVFVPSARDGRNEGRG